MYPIHLNLSNKLVVVAGGGKIALRKIHGLLDAGAIIIVVSPEAIQEIIDLHQQKALRWKSKLIEKEDYEDAFLIVAATNNDSINSLIASHAAETQLVNVVDQPHLGNFIVPSHVKRGKLILSVSTSGASPSLAKKIKTELKNTYHEDYESYLEFLQECRILVKNLYSEKERRSILFDLTDEKYLNSTELRETFKQELIEDAYRKTKI